MIGQLSTSVDAVAIQRDRRPVLVVDDNEVNRRVLALLLRATGERVDVAKSGAEALELVAVNSYALIFMDCHMPGMDGYDTTRALRTTWSASVLPIIAVTADAPAQVVERALSSGMNDWLQKPVQLGDLETMVGRWSSGSTPR